MPLLANLIAARIPDMPAPIINTSRLDVVTAKSDFELSEIDIGTSPTRTNEWWLVPDIDSVLNNPMDNLFELLRNRQLNWKEGYGKEKQSRSHSHIEKAKEGSKK